ncbi:MAG: Nif3-like dinuclear metal center hexameric protein [Burkholderiaceae bacterium]
MPDTLRGQRDKRDQKVKAGVSRQRLLDFLTSTLNPDAFSDYCPNGLQVQGKSTVQKLVAGVTASATLINAAAAAGADAILVHHGYFWRGENPCITGMKGERITALIKADINLFAYHLPLDAHPQFGNNVQLARVLKLPVDGQCGPDGLVLYGNLAKPISIRMLTARVRKSLGRTPLVVGPDEKEISRIAWCTGGAQDYIEAAVSVGAHAYISGEISERTTHIARECAIAYLGAGHHATERFGVQALGLAAADALGIDYEFIDDPNPV